jgi:hypothetical protein
VDSSYKYTLPYLQNLDAAITQREIDVTDPNYVFRGMETGTEWLKVLKDNEMFWRPRLLPELNKSKIFLL